MGTTLIAVFGAFSRAQPTSIGFPANSNPKGLEVVQSTNWKWRYPNVLPSLEDKRNPRYPSILVPPKCPKESGLAGSRILKPRLQMDRPKSNKGHRAASPEAGKIVSPNRLPGSVTTILDDSPVDRSPKLVYPAEEGTSVVT